MLTRRDFIFSLPALGCIISRVRAESPRRKRVVFCSSKFADSGFDPTFHSIAEVDWSEFYIRDLPLLLQHCCQAMGVKQSFFFSDDLPIQATTNVVDLDNPDNPNMLLGVGNLYAFSYEVFIAAVLHELGHNFCYRSGYFERILSGATQRKQELLVDILAGGAYARLEQKGISVSEAVRGQCSNLSPDQNLFVPMYTSKRGEPAARLVELDPQKVSGRIRSAKFYVRRSDNSIADLQSNILIGPSADGEPYQDGCLTKHQRRIDFVSMIAAAASWRTFGDLPDLPESHGTAVDRYTSFSFGYKLCTGNNISILTCLLEGSKKLGISL